MWYTGRCLAGSDHQFTRAVLGRSFSSSYDTLARIGRSASRKRSSASVLAATREAATLSPHSESSNRSLTEKSMSAKSAGNDKGWSRMLRS